MEEKLYSVLTSMLHPHSLAKEREPDNEKMKET
jgi:hypothetical protein